MEISLSQLQAYRTETYQTSSRKRLKSPTQAVEFVNRRGFIFLWPIKDVELPSLWAAVAGDRPVADDHDDPGHISWAWKDELLDKKVWYYSRLLKRRNTIVSLELAPYFYALSPNYGSPEEDFADQYQQGHTTLETKLVFEALVKEGPLDTLSLRKAAHLSGKSSNSAFTQALDTLQMEMRVMPVSISEAGSWHYAFVYDLTHRYYPELVEQSRLISESTSRKLLIEKYLDSVGAASLSQISSIFHWPAEITQRALNQLVQEEKILDQVTLPGQKGTIYASSKFLEK